MYFFYQLKFIQRFIKNADTRKKIIIIQFIYLFKLFVENMKKK